MVRYLIVDLGGIRQWIDAQGDSRFMQFLGHDDGQRVEKIGYEETYLFHVGA